MAQGAFTLDMVLASTLLETLDLSGNQITSFTLEGPSLKKVILARNEVIHTLSLYPQTVNITTLCPLLS
jgi:Leucine-rich repeat (LRR) protein